MLVVVRRLIALAGARWIPIAIVSGVVVTLAGQAARTIWDGVYTEEQAMRGARLYATHCAACHGDGLGGVESAPALVGATFYSNWEGESLDALYERMRISMPQAAPGSLSRAQNADILAFILQAGGRPAGSTPLDDRLGALTSISIRTYKP